MFSPTSSVVFTVYAPHLIERLLTLMAKLMVAPFRKWYITGNGRRHSRKRRSLPATDNFRFARSGSGPIAGNLSVHSQESQLCHFRTVPYIATLGTVGGYFSGCGCPALSMGFTIVVLDQMSVCIRTRRRYLPVCDGMCCSGENGKLTALYRRAKRRQAQSPVKRIENSP